MWVSMFRFWMLLYTDVDECLENYLKLLLFMQLLSFSEKLFA